ELADAQATQSYLRSDNLMVRRAALIALDQMEGGGLQAEQVTPLLACADPLLRQTASWIVGHHPEWGPVLAGFFRERLAAKTLTAEEREELSRQLAHLSRNVAIQELLARTLPAGSAETRLTALRAMAQAGWKH